MPRSLKSFKKGVFFQGEGKIYAGLYGSSRLISGCEPIYQNENFLFAGHSKQKFFKSLRSFPANVPARRIATIQTTGYFYLPPGTYANKPSVDLPSQKAVGRYSSNGHRKKTAVHF